MTTVDVAAPLSRPAGGRHPLGRPPAAAVPPPPPTAVPAPALPSATVCSAPAPAPATPVVPTTAPGEPLPAHILGDIVAGFAAAVPLWSEVVRHDPDGRRPVLLVATERYEVWVIGWTTGQHVRMHDHGDSAGAFVATAGELTEVVPDGHGGTAERTVPAGRPRHLTVGMVHDVVNRADAPATSIHVYSPPVTRMTYYDPETLDPVESEDFPSEVPLLGATASARVLHPAGRRAP
jgi:predicted metal-dependent enzyme (double-stranded beta helix superfamily)